MGSARDILQEIARTQAYDQLEAFCDSSIYQTLPQSDRELLASLLVAQGELQLSVGKDSVIQSFNVASKVAPENAEIQLRIAIALASKATDDQCLSLSVSIFKRASVLQPTCFEIWYQWGIALTRLGILSEDAAYLETAEAQFGKALEYAQSQQERGLLYWRRAICWYTQGKLSGEAFEHRMSLDFMQKAALEGINESTFWNDYGFLSQEFGALVRRQDLVRQALEFFQTSVKQNPSFFEAWQNLATLAQKLYAITAERFFFLEADRAFRQAVALTSDSVDLWLSWGQLLLGYGKVQRDVDVLRAALEKYEKAAALNPRPLAIISGWAEAQMLLGVYLERLDLLRESYNKILSCLEDAPKNHRLWYQAAICLTELGRYFGDESYMQQAIGKLKTGLNLYDADPLLWYGLVQVNLAFNEISPDQGVLEQTIAYCAKVMELGGEGVPQFFNGWGLALTKLGELTQEKGYIETAIEKFEWAIAQQARTGKFGCDREAVDPEWLYNYGYALDVLGQLTAEASYFEKAINVLSQVIILDPGFSHARFNLAVALSHLGDLMGEVECLQRAFDLFQTVVEQDNEDEIAWAEWGCALMSLAQLLRDPARPDISAALFEQAEAKLLQSLNLGNTATYYTLACLYSLVGNYPAAIFYLEQAEAESVLPPLDIIKQDKWLEEIRDTPGFHQFIQQLEMKNRLID